MNYNVAGVAEFIRVYNHYISTEDTNKLYDLFLATTLNYTDDTFFTLDKANGYMYINLSLGCNKLNPSHTHIKKLSRTLRNAIKLFAEYMLDTKDIKLIPDFEGGEEISGITNKSINISTLPLDNTITFTYRIYTSQSSKLRHRVISYLLEHYLGYLNNNKIDFDVSEFYKSLAGAVREIDIERLERDSKVKELKNKLTKGVNPYILDDWTPNLKEYKDIKAILSRIRKHFSQKKICAICGREFTPSHNKPNQSVCGNAKCIKFKNQKKKMLKRYIEKHKPQSTQKIIEYMKKREKEYMKRYPKMIAVYDWGRLIDELLEDLRVEENKKLR